MINIAGIKIPDSRLALEAQDILNDHGSELLQHMKRVILNKST
ncbi:hypothetical protein ACIQ1D_06475 [Lysinibacillus xylanilyticus]